MNKDGEVRIKRRDGQVFVTHMPTVLRVGPDRFYFVSHDLIHEPSHVHIDRDELSAKFWLSPVALARNLGFSANELRKI